MDSIAIILGYALMGIIAGIILLCAFMAGFVAVKLTIDTVEARNSWRRKMTVTRFKTGQDCVNYLYNRFPFTSSTTLLQAWNYFEDELRKEERK